MSWRTVALGDVLRHRKGIVTIDDTTKYKLCRVQLHRRGVVLRQHMLGAEIRTKKQQVCNAGDFLVAEMDAKVGGYGFVPLELDGAIVSSHYFLFEVDTKKLYPPYLEVVSQAEILQQQIVAKGSTNYASVRPSNILSWHIPLPNMETQKRIAHNFQATQKKLAEMREEITRQESLLAKFKQAILQEAIQGKLTADWRAANPDVEPASQLLRRIQSEKDRLIAKKKISKEKPLPEIAPEEVPFEIPKGWVWCRMGEAGIFQRGKSKHRPRNDPRLFEEGNIPFVQTGDVARSKHKGFRIDTCSSYYNEAGLSQSRLWPPGTMCITIAANIAETGFLTFPACIPDSVVTFTPVVSGKSPEFLRMFIELTRTAIEKFAPATAQKNINLQIINELALPLPPLAEQAAIVERVEALMTTCQALEAEIERSRSHAAQLLQAVLKEAFTSAS